MDPWQDNYLVSYCVDWCVELSKQGCSKIFVPGGIYRYLPLIDAHSIMIHQIESSTVNDTHSQASQNNME